MNVFQRYLLVISFFMVTSRTWAVESGEKIHFLHNDHVFNEALLRKAHKHFFYFLVVKKNKT